ncbi:MAG: UbiA family prenyltransferase [Planctomycetes bacterium]|nr:UbiA family prenyltransferase [Planctomycetota bacterium]
MSWNELKSYDFSYGNYMSQVRAYLQLLRFPTVFTAIADVLMGVAVAVASSHNLAVSGDLRGELLALLGPIVALIAASSCLYLAGMVLNDYFDRQQDAAERPTRPIPSGRVSPSTAAGLGAILLLAGVACSLVAARLLSGWRPALIGVAIAGAVLAYDGLLKRTVIAPLAMGTCRGLNALLGMSLAATAWQTPHYLIAGGLGLFVAGITAVGRTEAKQSHRGWLGIGLLLMWLGMGTIAAFPHYPGIATQLGNSLQVWLLAWLFLGLQTGWRLSRALVDPTPSHVQAAVRGLRPPLAKKREN